MEPVEPEKLKLRLPVRPEAPAVPRTNLPPLVSAVMMALLVVAFCTWKAVVLFTFTRLVLVKVLAAFLSGTLLDSLASLSVPELMLLALSEVRPEPSPVKELEALEKVLAPVKDWVPFSLARLASLDKLAEVICTPFIW